MVESLLSPYRVLDLTDEKGFFCGKILADLGADVIKIEKPGGDPSRNRGPFFGDKPHPERSLYWATNNTSKRGITLNMETQDGKTILIELVKRSDFIIESFPPGYMQKQGLDYGILKQINPRIIMIAITPFGQSGPYRNYKATDIVSMAMGGLMFITGDTDRPPIRITIPQAGLLAGAHGATGAMIAHYHREITGEGQHVDVSMQEAVARLLFMEPAYWDFEQYLIRRLGPRIHRGKIFQTELWRCKDGQVLWRFFGGLFGRRVQGLVDWMDEEGMAGVLKEVEDWEKIDMSQVTQEQWDAWEEAFSNFFLQHTMAELHREAQKRWIFLAPSYTTKEICEDAQLASRDYWVSVEHPEWGATVTYPGAPCKLSLTPWKIYRRAPLIGEHNEEIYSKELGLSKSELVILKAAGII